MNKETEAIRNDLAQLVEDARALIAVTADATGEKVVEARNRLAATLEKGKEAYGWMRDKAAEGARTADVAVRKHPYEAIAIGVGVGAMLGFILSSSLRASRRDGSPE
jgi:ElaB/YqjD/DUF883 family membrane-anchored ribosome-binding protein